MRAILTEREYKALLNAKEIAVAEARAQVQKELEAVKDKFCESLVEQSGVSMAFAGVGGRSAYEHWQKEVREIVKTLNMPK